MSSFKYVVIALATITLGLPIPLTFAQGSLGQGSLGQGSFVPPRLSRSESESGNVTPPSGSRIVAVPQCLVTVKDQVRLPAREAGMLVELSISEGDEVTEDQVLANIDAEAAQMELKVALAKQESADAESESEVGIKYAQASAEVAKAEHADAQATQARDTSSVAAAEVRRLKLKLDTANLQIDQAVNDKKIAGLTAQSHAVTVEAHQKAIQRREVKSPLKGVVVERYRNQGEWVAPGDPICRIVSMATLRVEGYVDAATVLPHSVKGKSADVVIDLGEGQKFKTVGEITYVSPLVEANGRYRIRCEIANEKRDDVWVVMPGLLASLKIVTE